MKCTCTYKKLKELGFTDRFIKHNRNCHANKTNTEKKEEASQNKHFA